ncbi:MAG: hypothetical protein R3E32_15310 [Chitinophagales bacterium]
MNIPYIKIIKYIAVTSALVLLLLFSLQWAISRYLYPFISSQLQSKIQDASDDMYKLHFNKLNINIAAQEILLKDIHIQPNMEQVLQRYGDCTLPTYNIFDLQIPKFTITGIDLYDALWQKHVNINNVQLHEGTIKMLQLEKRNCPSIEVPDSCEVEQPIEEVLTEIQSFFVGDILVKNSKMEYLKVIGQDTLQVAITQNINAHLSDVEMATPQYMGETIQDLPIKASNIQFDINETIVPIPKSKYNLGISCASFSLDESLLKLQSLQLIPKDGGNKNVQSIEIQEITLNTSDFFDGDYKALMRSEQWTIPAVELNEPKIVLKKYNNVENDWKKNEMKSIDFQQILTPKLNTFGIESFTINDASLLVLDAENEEELMSINSINLAINNFRVDHSLEDQKDKLFYADDFKITTGNFRRQLPDALSTLTMDQISLDMVNEKADMKKVNLSPNHSKLELGHIVGHRVGWTRIANMDVSMNGLDINSLLSRGTLNVKKILLTNAFIEVFLDERLEHPSERVLPMPQAMLQNLPITTYIDNIEVKDSKIEYTTYGPTASKMGLFTLDKFNANINNITNNSLLITNDTKATLQAEGYVMGTGFLKIDFSFPLNSSEYAHTFSGSLSGMDMTDFNPILEVVPARVDGGKIDKITFSAFATDKRARGKLHLYYNDLKITLKDKETGKVTAKQDIISFFADKLFIRNDNPKRGGKFREGIIDYERDDSKSIINFWWKGILTGIVSTISTKNLINDDNTSAQIMDKMQKRQEKKVRRKERRKQLRTKIQRLLENPFK